MTGRDERGIATVEVVALVPILVLLATFVLQGAAAIWTVSAADTAARHAARARSLGQDPREAADASLPGAMEASEVDHLPGSNGVRITVEVPRVSPLPVFHVTREVDLP